MFYGEVKISCLRKKNWPSGPQAGYLTQAGTEKGPSASSPAADHRAHSQPQIQTYSEPFLLPLSSCSNSGIHFTLGAIEVGELW